MTNKKIPFLVYSESTPNPASMKFVANHLLLDGPSVEYNKESNLENAPIATRLFQFPFVSSIFISGNFITITKTDSIEWGYIVNEIRTFIQDYLREGNEIFKQNTEVSLNKPERKVEINNEEDDDNKFPQDIEMNEKISRILDEYIKPGVESDGGAIDFKSFQNGKVTVTLKGACSGCPSSTVTLKAGIESVLKRFIPEVKEVVAQEL